MDSNISSILARCFSVKNYKRTIKSDKQCAWCGRKGSIKASEILLDTMKEKQLFAEPVVFCDECAFTLRCEWFRKYNFVVSGKGRSQKFQILKHAEVWDVLLDRSIVPPYFISLTSTHKKSNVLYGDVNYIQSEKRKVVFDQQQIEFSLIDDLELFTLVHRLYNEFEQPKKCIKTGEYKVGKLTESQYRQLIFIEKGTISRYRGGSLFNLVVDFVQKEKT